RSAAERILRVANLRFDRADRKTERFGRDDRDDRPRAGAEVLRPALYDDRPVRHDVDVCRRASAAAAPQMRRDAHAGLDRPRFRIAGRMTRVPAEWLRAALEVLDPHRVRPALRRVLDAELDRIHFHAGRGLLHPDFREEAA